MKKLLILLIIASVCLPSVLSFNITSGGYTTNLYDFVPSGSNITSGGYETVTSFAQPLTNNITSGGYTISVGVLSRNLNYNLPTPQQAQPAGPGGGGGQTGPSEGTNQQPKQNTITNETLQQLNVTQIVMAAACANNETFSQRLFSQCRIPGNNKCDDGENYLIHKDCTINLRTIKEGQTFKEMWLLRFILLFSVFLLARDSKSYPFIVITTLLLFIYNKAFVPVGFDFNERACMDVNMVINFGYCTFPEKPVIGWILGLSMLALLLTTIFRERKKDRKGKKQEVDRKDPISAVVSLTLALLFLYGWLVASQGVALDRDKCMDVSFFANFGRCVIPTRPEVGWLIGLIAIAVIALYFYQNFFPKRRKKGKVYKQA